MTTSIQAASIAATITTQDRGCCSSISSFLTRIWQAVRSCFSQIFSCCHRSQPTLPLTATTVITAAITTPELAVNPQHINITATTTAHRFDPNENFDDFLTELRGALPSVNPDRVYRIAQQVQNIHNAHGVEGAITALRTLNNNSGPQTIYLCITTRQEALPAVATAGEAHGIERTAWFTQNMPGGRKLYYAEIPRI